MSYLAKNVIFLIVIILLLIQNNFAQNDFQIETPNLIVEGIPPIPKLLLLDLYDSVKRKQSSFISFKSDGSILGYNDAYNPFILTASGVNKDFQVDLNAPEDILLRPGNEGSFIFTADTGGNENKQLYLYDFEAKKKTQLTNDPAIKNVTSYLWSKQGDKIYFVSSDKSSKTSLIYSLKPESNELTILTTLKSDVSYLSDSNGEFILFYNYISNNQTEYFLYNLKTKKIDQITKENAFFKDAKFSNKAKSLYFLSDKEGKFFNLYNYNLDTLATKKVNTQELNISSFKISPDELSVAFKVNDAGAEFIRIFQLEKSQTVMEISKPDSAPGVIERYGWKNNDELGFTLESLKNPPEIKLYNIRSSELKTIAKGSGDSSILQNLDETKILKWKSFDNREISGLISKPNLVNQGEKLPVIIDIHGGPKLQYQPYYSVFKSYPTAKLKAVTIFPQIRGSSGFGREFETLDNLDKREDAIKDVEALIEWIKTQPDLDSKRIVLKGDSYGGFVALAVALRNQSQIKAVIAEKPVVSLKNTADYSPQSIKEILFYEYGPTSDKVLMAKLEKLSALSEENLKTWKVPLFLSIGQNDVRVPVTDVENLKDRLKAKGIPVWFMKAKNEGHFWSDFENNVFLNVAEINFLKMQGGF